MPRTFFDNDQTLMGSPGGMSASGWDTYNKNQKGIYDRFRKRAEDEGRAQGITDATQLDTFATNRAAQLFNDWGRETGIESIDTNTIALEHGLLMAAAAAGGAYFVPGTEEAAAVGGSGGEVLETGAAAGSGEAATEMTAADAAAMGDLTGGTAGSALDTAAGFGPAGTATAEAGGANTLGDLFNFNTLKDIATVLTPAASLLAAGVISNKGGPPGTDKLNVLAPTDMPILGGPNTILAQRAATAEQLNRRGRASTVLTSRAGETLGAGPH